AHAEAALQRAYAAASRIGAPVDLLEWIEAHCRATGPAPTALGVQVVNDPRFVSGLREGRSPRLKPEARVRAYLEAAIRTARNAGSAVSRIQSGLPAPCPV